MALLCAIGIVAVSYGMLAENNMVFIAGLLCGISGYLLIRRRLKQN
jgi:NAD/NADP transhydrogenase beta subunit